MSRFRIQDLQSLERSPTSPGSLRVKIGELLVQSVNAVAEVEMLDRDTGEYRIVLHGTLDLDDPGAER